MMSASHEIEVYVRFSETDAAGHVNNVSYFSYFEEARTKLFRDIGIDEDHKQSHLSFILASTKCDYLAQAYAGQMLKVSTNVSRVGNKSFSVKHVITNADTGLAVAEASATMVCFNYADQKTESIPATLRDNIESKMANHAV